jgi:hypothetical protein
MIMDIGLEPNTAYTYQAHWIKGRERINASNTIETITMDTTSHEFEWEIHSFEDYGDVSDIWVFDENNIWAVGLLLLENINIGWQVFRWDGETWENNDPSEGVGNVNSIFALDENNIWVGSTVPHFWNGNDWITYLPNDGFPAGLGRITGIWGTSNSDMYFVTHKNNIVHFDGTSFTTMAEFTDSIHGAFNEIIGWVDPETGEKYIYVQISIGSLGGRPGTVIHYVDEEWKILWDIDNGFFENPLAVTSTIKIIGNKLIAKTLDIGGSILTIHDAAYPNLYEIVEQFIFEETNMFASLHLAGNGENDFFGAGMEGRFFHFNGKTSRIYEIVDRWYLGIDMKNNIVALASMQSPVIVIGRRYE